LDDNARRVSKLSAGKRGGKEETCPLGYRLSPSSGSAVAGSIGVIVPGSFNSVCFLEAAPGQPTMISTGPCRRFPVMISFPFCDLRRRIQPA